jgi:hypothetical protein
MLRGTTLVGPGLPRAPLSRATGVSARDRAPPANGGGSGAAYLAIDRSERDSRTHSAPHWLRASTIPGSLRLCQTAPTRSDQRRFALLLPAESSRRDTRCQ